MNFYSGESKKNEEPVINCKDYGYESKFFQLPCKLSIKIGFANSDDEYLQEYEFFVNLIYSKEKNRFIIQINAIENSVIKL